jgi:hypothetical protein
MRELHGVTCAVKGSLLKREVLLFDKVHVWSNKNDPKYRDPQECEADFDFLRSRNILIDESQADVEAGSKFIAFMTQSLKSLVPRYLNDSVSDTEGANLLASADRDCWNRSLALTIGDGSDFDIVAICEEGLPKSIPTSRT